jgi:hypothetical protein
MNLRRSFSATQIALGIATALLALGIATSAYASARMYTGSMIIVAFGNDVTTGTPKHYGTLTSMVPPWTVAGYGAMPLTGKCNTAPLHLQETLTFPTTALPPPQRTGTVMFTVPQYGGNPAVEDTNSDTIPDIAAGCASITGGDPLTGSGTINTTGLSSTSRTSLNPRGFGLPQSALNIVKSGEGSAAQYGYYLWEVHFADLHNEAGAFAKNGGDGNFTVVRNDENQRSVQQTAGKNQFGGVMSLLGSYGDNEGYFYNNATTTVGYFNWLWNYLGVGGQATLGGVVTNGFNSTYTNFLYTRASGYPATSTVYAENFKWTTGTVKVTAVSGSYPTVLERKGYDSRTVMGAGVIQLVSPMLTHWVGEGESATGEIGMMTIEFAPEPSSSIMLGAGAALLGLIVHARRRSKR